jgi:hypothetical protein
MTVRLDWFGHEFLSVEMLNGFEMFWDIPRLCWTVKDLLVPRNVAPSRFSQDLKKEWSNKDAYACTILLILLTASNPHIIGLGASVNLSDPVRFHSMSQLQPSVSSTYCTVKAISERLCSTTDGKARHTKEIQKKNRSHRDHTKYHEQVLCLGLLLPHQKWISFWGLIQFLQFLHFTAKSFKIGRILKNDISSRIGSMITGYYVYIQ